MPEVTAEEFVRLVAGVLCPCGHASVYHEKPNPEIDGEVMGACFDRDCGCKGVIDLMEDYDD